MRKVFKVFAFFLVLLFLVLLFLVFSPSESVEEFYVEKHNSYVPFQKYYGSMDFVLNGAKMRSDYSVKRPSVLHGIYITGWTAGTPRFEKLLKQAKRSGINAFVIDVKDATGYLSFDSDIPFAEEIHSNRRKIPDLQKIARECIENGIYPIARIVVFKDPVLARNRKDLVVRKKNGAIFYDRSGLPWVDPYSKTIWKYNVDVAKAAIAAGFREIQFDYVRFPAVPSSLKLVYPANKTHVSKADNIAAFLKYAVSELHPYGVKVEADVFGLVLSNKEDLGIGQNLEKMAKYADYICPMVYPSHYWSGSFGYSDPDAHPYEIVDHALKDGIARLRKIHSKCQLIPYLQDFSLYHNYSVPQVEAQVKAVYDNGLKSWFMWNAANIYTFDAFGK